MCIHCWKSDIIQLYSIVQVKIFDGRPKILSVKNKYVLPDNVQLVKFKNPSQQQYRIEFLWSISRARNHSLPSTMKMRYNRFHGIQQERESLQTPKIAWLKWLILDHWTNYMLQAIVVWETSEWFGWVKIMSYHQVFTNVIPIILFIGLILFQLFRTRIW